MIHRRFRVPLALCAAAGLTACSGHADGGPGVVHSVAIEPQSAALCVGDSLLFTGQVLDDGGHPVAGAPVRWSSSAPETVAIDTASGVAHALAFGSTVVTASARGITSNPGALDVPQDLVPEFVPDAVVLAPLDTMTLGVRLRRSLTGPVPNRIPLIAPFDSTVAGIDATGLVQARAVGTARPSLSACGFTGVGAVQVYTPDSVTGQAYLWLSGPAELRFSLPARAFNFFTASGKPAFQVFSRVGNTRVFLYEDTLALAGWGLFSLDSLLSNEVTSLNLPCNPPRPFAFYLDSPQTLLTSMHGGSTAVTTYVQKTNYVAVSGRTVARMQGIVGGNARLDTLQAIYTFSAPLKDTTGVCP